MSFLYAALVNKQLIYATHYQPQKLDKLKCPKCLKKVRFVKANGKTPYFKHLAKIVVNDETAEHQALKKQLFVILTDIYPHVSLEKALPNQKVRPDILIKGRNRQLAIEIQCSPLSEASHQFRHNHYRQFGLEDIWLVGKKLHLNQRLGKKHIRFLRYQKNLGFYLIELHLDSQEIKLKYQIMRQDFATIARYQVKTVSLTKHGFNQLLSFMKTEQTMKNYPPIPLKWDKYQKELETIKRLAYANGYNVKKLLDECYTSYRQPYFLSSETTAKSKIKLGLADDLTIYLPIALRHLNPEVIRQKKSRQIRELLY
ncbi:competence protein CoiA family protein [Holzapfeliella sp. He02]|uniref:Competence protein CoiA family protein n=1 Tax=Holzapfeliella saturejae TaxID=3082953 RepID=A0ABU8SI53_9LACO